MGPINWYCGFVLRFSRTECDGLSVLTFGLSLELMHDDATEPGELGDRVNPEDNIIRKDASYDKGVSNCSGDCVGGDHSMLHRLVCCSRHCIREKAEHKIRLTIS